MGLIEKFVGATLCGIAALMLGAASVSAMSHGGGLPKRPMLTTAAAETAALACEKYAKEKGWKLNIAILDAGGELLYFRRDIDSFRGSIEIAINKAFTATQFGFPTRLFGDTIINMAPGIQYTPRLIIFPGGLPIKSGEVLIGGIGTSGATGDQDEECAQVGLDAIAGMLN
ncbi:MAG: heme-binding protein [SAR324 cluster bacterium]|nr:heme-binding protein [SAR324 cluster bacterium]